ncbi:sugar-binding transcriptional regulator [Georgenia sp. Z1491]|uniref:sugar-binding transcriptional regulator n=1 Tax=Georgenia sp. Z1491 TaxID=3416707 RepID=UPI003CF95279
MPVRSGDEERDLLLLRVATLYHEQELTQQEVAERLHLTRWQVGRLLQEARRTGIVRIEIVHPRARSHALESELVSRTGLTAAVVVPPERDPVATRARVAGAAGELLADLKESPGTLAVSWGRTMIDLAEQIPPSWSDGTVVVQANAGLPLPGASNPGQVVAELARQARGTAVFLQAPAIVESPDLAATLMGDASLRRVLDQAREADALLFSLGEPVGTSVLVEAGYLSAAEVERLVAQGAVGDVLGRFIDSRGRPADPAIDARTVGLTLDEVRASRLPIAVAAGVAKTPAALAAVTNGLCKILVTDEDLAAGLLASLPPEPPRPSRTTRSTS